MNSESSTVHRRAWDALPWYVAGSASAADVQLVEQHLPRCQECRAELAFHRQVHAGLLAGGPQLHELPDPEPALQRLQARIAASADEGLAAQLAPATPRHWSRWLVAAVVVQAVGLSGLGFALIERRATTPSDASFRTLSRTPAQPSAATLRVVPAPTMDFDALRQLLARQGLVLVDASADGSSLGLRPRDANPAAVAMTLTRLRATAGILLAEPVSAPAATPPAAPGH